MRHFLNGGLVFLAGLAAASAVSAAGFYIPEVGTPHSLGTGGVANPVNVRGADAAWTNPAGMTALDTRRAVAGLQLVLPKMEFDLDVGHDVGDDGGNAGQVAAIPSFFYVNPLSDKVRLGFSVTAPLGGGVDYGDNFAGRYNTQMATLAGVSMAPSIAYKVNDRFSVGGGISFVYTIFEQDIAINPAVLPTQNGGDGKLKIEEATDWGYQPFLGMTYQLNERALFGLVYRAEADVELNGDVKTRNLLVPVSADSIDIEWDNPQWLEAGLSYQLDDQNTLYLNAGWQDWSAFSDNQLAFSGGALNPVTELDRNWDDTWHAGVAFTHHRDDGRGTSIGFSYESSPVEDEDRTFDLPVDELFKLSFSYFQERKDNFDFSLGGTVYFIGDAEITSTAQGVPVSGEFDTNTILFLGGSARYTF